METLLNWDYALFHQINQFKNILLDVFFLWITQFSISTWLALITLGMFFSKRKDRWKIAIFVIVLFIISDLVADYVVKPIFNRPRPCQTFDDIILLIHCQDSPSFPSGHTTTMFAVAVFLSMHHPQWVGILASTALMVSFSRIYIGAHYPLDVLGGALLGILLAMIWEKVFLFTVRSRH